MGLDWTQLRVLCTSMLKALTFKPVNAAEIGQKSSSFLTQCKHVSGILYIFHVVAFLFLCFLFSSCDVKLEKTEKLRSDNGGKLWRRQSVKILKLFNS